MWFQGHASWIRGAEAIRAGVRSWTNCHSSAAQLMQISIGRSAMHQSSPCLLGSQHHQLRGGGQFTRTASRGWVLCEPSTVNSACNSRMRMFSKIAWRPWQGTIDKSFVKDARSWQHCIPIVRWRSAYLRCWCTCPCSKI